MHFRNAIRPLIVCFAAALAVAGCTQKQKPPEPPPPAPHITVFTASATQVHAGEKVKLTWDVKDAVSVDLKDAVRGVPSGFDGSPSGSLEVPISDDTLFELTATNARGVHDSQVLVVQVLTGASEVQFIASPSRITAGESATLAWTARGAQSISLSNDKGEEIDLGGQTTSGSVKVSPVIGTGYVLTVDGVPHEAAVDVRPMINAFAANAEGVKPGEMITLSWKTTGATRVTLIRKGGGEVASETDPAKVADGSYSETMPQTVSGAEVFTYELRAEGTSPLSVSTQTVTVYVAGSPTILEFKVPDFVAEGGSYKVSWKTAASTHVVILQDGAEIYSSPDLAAAAQGSLEIASPAQDVTLTLRATDGRGGVAVSDPFVVDPVGKPTFTSFTASPQPGIAAGGDAVTLDWDIPNARHIVVVAQGQYTVLDLRGKVAAKGTWTTYPNKDTTYELVADNTLGDSIDPQTASVTVTTPAELIFNPPSAVQGDQVQVTGHTVTGGGDVLGLPVVEHNAAGDAFVDISSTGKEITALQYQNYNAQVLLLPEVFQTRVYGTPIASDKVNVSPNGWFSFQSTTFSGPNSSTNSPLPSTALVPLAIAPYWMDLYVYTWNGSHVFWRIDGSGDDHRLIIQWESVGVNSGWPMPTVTFEAQVYADGRIVFAYKDIATVNGMTPSVGVVNSDESTALVLPSGTVPQTGDTFRFFGRTTLPLTMTAPTSPYISRVMIGASNFIEIESDYPVVNPNDLELSEVNSNPTVANGQWIEVHNTKSFPIDLNGFTLDFGGGVTVPITQSVTVPAQGYAVLAQQAGAGDGLTTAFEWGTSATLYAGSMVQLVHGTTPFASIKVPPTPLPAGHSLHTGALAAGMLTASGTTSPATCLSGATATYGSNGQFGTPGAANGDCPSLTYAGAITANFEPIAATGTRIPFSSSDEGDLAINLPAPVNVGGWSYSTLYVSTNGFITLTNPYGTYYNNKSTPTPWDPLGTIAPYWDDLNAPSGGVYWERKTPGVQPNDGYTIVSWEHVTRWGYSDDLSFQVKFFDTGTIEFHYGTLTGDNGSSATSWLEAVPGLAAWPININSSSPGLSSNTAYQFNLQ